MVDVLLGICLICGRLGDKPVSATNHLGDKRLGNRGGTVSDKLGDK